MSLLGADNYTVAEEKRNKACEKATQCLFRIKHREYRGMCIMIRSTLNVIFPLFRITLDVLLQIRFHAGKTPNKKDALCIEQ